MTPPRWRPLPSLLGLDARVRGVSHEARGVYLLLVCASDVDGVVRYAGPVRHAVDALAGSGACASLDELVTGELVEIDVDGELVLPDVPRWQAEHAPRSTPARPSPEASDDSPQEGAEVDRRTAGRRLSKQWAKRGLKDTDAKLRWLTSETGRSYLESAGIPLSLATAIATGAATPDATPHATPSATLTPPGGKGGATTDATPPATPRFPPVPLPREETEKQEGEGKSRDSATRATHDATPRATRDATRSATPHATQVAPERSGPRHGALPQSPSPSLNLTSEGDTRSVDEVLHDLAQASNGGLSTSGSVDQREAVVTALRAAGVDLAAVGLALRSPAEVWPRWDRVASQRCISVAMLAGKAPFECAGVAELVAFVRAQGASPVDHGGTVIPTLAETEARVARERENRARILAGPPRVMPPWRRAAPTTETETKEVAGG